MQEERLKRIGPKIRALRKERGVSRELLAGSLGVALSTVYNWEKGSRFPSTESIFALMDFFQVGPSVVLDISEDPEDFLGPKDKLALGKRYIEEAELELAKEEARHEEIAEKIYAEAVKHSDSSFSIIPKDELIGSIIAIVRKAEKEGGTVFLDEP